MANTNTSPVAPPRRSRIGKIFAVAVCCLLILVTVAFFTVERDPHRGESLFWFGRVCEPHFRRVARAIEFCRFEGAHGHSSAENGDGGGFFKRIFDNQPAAHGEKRDHSQDEQAAEGRS